MSPCSRWLHSVKRRRLTQTPYKHFNSPSIIAVSRFDHVKLQALFIYLQNCLHQNAGAVRHIRRCCKFFWRVADSIDAWNEDHSDRNDSRKILSIVPCAAWHQLRCQTQTCRCFLNELTKPLICGRWNRSYIERSERNCRACIRGDFFSRLFYFFKYQIDFRFLQISNLQTHHYFPRNYVRSARLSLNRSDGSNLTAGNAPCSVVD